MGILHVNGKDGVKFYTRKKMITSRFILRGFQQSREELKMMQTENQKNHLEEKDEKYIWHSMKPYNPSTMVVTKAEGSWITDTEGNKYLDGMSGLWCVNVGYGRKELAEAAYEQLKGNCLFPFNTKPFTCH